MQVNSINQNNTNFNGRFKFNATIKNIVQKSEITEMVRFNNFLNHMKKVNDNKIFVLERKPVEGFYSRNGVDKPLNMAEYSLCEQVGDKKNELSSSVYATLGWINNILETIYPISSINENKKNLETEIFEKCL